MRPTDYPIIGPEVANVEFARKYITALELGATGDALAQFFTPDIVQEEFPNRLTVRGATRNLNDLLVGAERGQRLMAKQRFEWLNHIASGSTVVVELQWSGTIGIDAGSMKKGDTMKARFAIVLEFRDGRIARQRNYDCFEPWD